MNVTSIKRYLFAATIPAAIIGGFTFGLAGTEPAAAQVCLPHAEITSRLEQKFEEKQRGYGLIGDRAVMEIFASEGGSWTIIITHSNGITCVIATGTDFEQAIIAVGNEV